MSERFYTFASAVSRKLGPWFFRTAAGCVATGYFLLFPKRVGTGLDFYRALFPHRRWPCHLWCVLRQYYSFTTVFLDRFILQSGGELSFDSEGWEHLETAVAGKTGGVILMSHMGNWEVAAHLLKQRGAHFPMLLYMGARHKEEIERLQKESLAASGIRIIAVEPGGGSPFDIIEGARLLKGGGLVALTGDVVWDASQRTVQADFLDHTAALPEIPHVLALLSGAPIFVMFSFRTGDRHYRFSVTPPIHVRADGRKDRQAAVQRSAAAYADLLARALEKYPFQWYHFKPFLEKKPG